MAIPVVYRPLRTFVCTACADLGPEVRIPVRAARGLRSRMARSLPACAASRRAGERFGTPGYRWFLSTGKRINGLLGQI